MKEKVFIKSKESKKSTGARSHDKEKVKVQKRRKDSLSLGGPSPSLEQQFKDIVKTARTDVVSSMVRSQIQSSQSPKRLVDIQAKQVKVALEDCCSPVRKNITRDKECDVAPSPITPPLPKRIRLAIKENVGGAPSPEGTAPLPQTLNLLQEKRAMPAEDQPELEEVEEVTFFDAHDTSIIDSGSGLSLDGLIDEIFINQTKGINPDKTEEDPLIGTSPNKCSGDLLGDTDKEPNNLENSNKSQTAVPFSNKNLANEPVLPILNISAGMCDTSHDSIIEVFLNEEGFPDDLSLTDSQLLEIDGKGTLLKERTLEQLSTDPQSNSVHNEGLKTTEVESASKEKPSTMPPKPTLDFGFSVPPAPCLDWVQKALDSRQRLRSITQEVSRLNAMVLRARRTLWPRQGQDTERQHVAPSSTCSQSSHLLSITSRQSTHPPHVSDPEWNLS